MNWAEITFRAVLILAGFACVACEVWGSYDFMIEKRGHWDYLVAGSLVLTSLAAILPLAAEYAHRQAMHGLKWAAWLTVPVALAFVFTVSIQRTGTATDADETSRQQRSKSITIAQAEEAEAKTQLATDKATVERNCGKWGPICDKAKAAQASTEAKLTVARKLLKEQGIAVDDSMARRLVSYLPFLTKDQVQLYQPLLLPLGLALVGSLLIAIGARGPNRKQEPPKPAVQEAPRLKVVASNPSIPVGSVKRILTDILEAADGERVEIAELASRYRDACRTQGRRSTSLDEFTVAVGDFCDAIGIKRRKIGNKLYLLDVKLLPLTAMYAS